MIDADALIIELQQAARDTPGTPPPVTATELAGAEAKLGFALPTLLRRIYLEVSNGIVLDLFGLPSAATTHDEDFSLFAWREKLLDSPEDETIFRHAVPIVDYGCAQWLWVDTDGSLLLMDNGEVYRSPPTFAEWLTAALTKDEHSLLFAPGEPRWGINPFTKEKIRFDSHVARGRKLTRRQEE